MILKTELYPYQQEAVDKLIHIRVGALYFEMGTGKTRTALEMVKIRHEDGKVNSVLWLCPCSVKKNLRDDLDKHADGWDDLIRIEGIESLSSSDRLYMDLLSKSFDMVIVDESNLVKNFFAKRTRRITEIGECARYRLILNGTPVSRNEADLYAQWYFLDHRIFGYRSFRSFAANHLEYDDRGKVRRVLNTDYLAEKIAPYSVVKKKTEVLSLPDKTFEIRRYRSDGKTCQSYHDIGSDIMDHATDLESDAFVYRFLTGLQLATSGRRVEDVYENDGWHLHSQTIYHNPKDNPRIQTLLDVLEERSEAKIIIWVKYHHESREIASVLPEGSYAVFTGEKTASRRNAELERFKTDSDCRYLISNKSCGGYGLNLQFCHCSIFYDNDFNFATRNQAEDRIHRLGQENEVAIIDILSDLRIDTMIHDCLMRKENLAEEMKREIKEKGRKFLDQNWIPTEPKAGNPQRVARKDRV